MAKIILIEGLTPYSCTLDTGVMLPIIKEAYLPVQFNTEDGEVLSVVMRDSGFEVVYSADFGETGFHVGPVEFKNGNIKGM